MLRQHKTNSTNPLVSCILPTRDRKQFFRQALKYFQAQAYSPKELVIIDDGRDSSEELIPKDNSIRYCRLDVPTSLGAKVNLAINISTGNIIQRLDDDDYYAPNFLTTTVSHLVGRDPASAIVGFDRFLVLIAATGELKFSGEGWFAGATLCFYKHLWEISPFRDVTIGEDWWFLKDHAVEKIELNYPGLYILVRHLDGHTWTKLGQADVTDYFVMQPNYTKSLNQLLPKADLEFYKKLRRPDGG